MQSLWEITQWSSGNLRDYYPFCNKVQRSLELLAIATKRSQDFEMFGNGNQGIERELCCK